MTARGEPVACVTFYATRSGGTTIDSGDEGGNPFASALIELSERPRTRLGRLPEVLRKRTRALSDDHQDPEHFGTMALPGWRFAVGQDNRHESRVALVLVVSDYSLLSATASLPGAACDRGRVGAMLARHGFAVTYGTGGHRAALRRDVARFARRSQDADVAVIYSTGHGFECDGTVYLLPGDFPSGGLGSCTGLQEDALAVPDMASAACARQQNLVFFAGCRSQVQSVEMGHARRRSPKGSGVEPA